MIEREQKLHMWNESDRYYDDKEGTTITNQLSIYDKDLGHLAIRGLVSGPAMIIALSSIPSESPWVRMMISRMIKCYLIRNV